MILPPPFLSPKYMRQLSGYLAQCGLSHWRGVLVQFMEHYAGLEMLVDDDREGPQASIIRLLRDMSRQDMHPTDQEFAVALADLAFLCYKVRRAKPSFTLLTGELWQPLQQPLWIFRQGYDLGGYPCPQPPIPNEVVTEMLLRQVNRSEHPVRH